MHVYSCLLPFNGIHCNANSRAYKDTPFLAMHGHGEGSISDLHESNKVPTLPITCIAVHRSIVAIYLRLSNPSSYYKEDHAHSES